MKLLLAVLPAIIIGCSSSRGIKVDGTKYQQVIENKTTLTELKNLLGEPQSVLEDVIQKKYIEESMVPKTCGAIGDRVTAYVYSYTESGFSSSTIEMKRFLVNKNGVVCLKQQNKHGI